MNKPKVERGTFCGVIQRQLLSATCPLPKGTCMWKHRATGLCEYTEKELSPQEFAALVGLPTPSTEVVNSLSQQLQTRLKSEL